VSPSALARPRDGRGSRAGEDSRVRDRCSASASAFTALSSILESSRRFSPAVKSCGAVSVVQWVSGPAGEREMERESARERRILRRSRCSRLIQGQIDLQGFLGWAKKAFALCSCVLTTLDGGRALAPCIVPPCIVFDAASGQAKPGASVLRTAHGTARTPRGICLPDGSRTCFSRVRAGCNGQHPIATILLRARSVHRRHFSIHRFWEG